MLDKQLRDGFKKNSPKKFSSGTQKNLSLRTRKYARGNLLQPGEKHQSFDEEATVYVWHEKNVLKPSEMNPGHAAMKLTRYNDKEKKNTVVRYISWWPGDGASKKTEAQAGSRTDSTRTDRVNEMSHDRDLNLILKLQIIRLASQKLPNGIEEFKELAEIMWGNLTTRRQIRLRTDFNCKKNFSNLAKLGTKPKANQKLLFLGDNSHYTAEDLAKYVLVMRWGGTDFIDNMYVVKQPYAKIYIPCSCLPTSIYPLEVYQCRSAWGLSMDAMNYRFRSFEDGLRLYKMQAFDDNCIGAVWECMKSGLAQVITPKFRMAKGLVSTLAHFKSLLPSDAIKASIDLSNEILRMSKQQQFLDLRAYEYQKQVDSMANANECFGGGWRNYVRLSPWWRDMSSAKSTRPLKKVAIDKLVLQYDKNERALNKTNKDIVQDILKLEAVWETRCRCVLDVKKTKEDIDELHSKLKAVAKSMKGILEIQAKFKSGSNDPELKWWDPDDLIPEMKEKDKKYNNLKRSLLKLKKKLKSVEVHAGKALKVWEQELKRFEKVRYSRARLLVALHEAIFKYVSTHKHSKIHSSNPSRRYIAAVLLGQFVSWMFCEVAHDNLSIGFHGMNEGGIRLTMGEKDKRLGDAFPNLRIMDRYPTDSIEEDDFLETHRKRDRI